MTDKRYTLMNTAGAMLCVNLDTADEHGKRDALILMDRERSRPLSESELVSREVQKLLAAGDLRDVTGLEASRTAPAGRLRRPKPTEATPVEAIPSTRPSAPEEALEPVSDEERDSP